MEKSLCGLLGSVNEAPFICERVVLLFPFVHPYKVKVLPTHDASKVRASGSGLKTTGVPSSLPVKFNIDGKDAGPRREAQEANICDNHDGTYLVSYVPDMTDSEVVSFQL
ncbi:unnamed protein product [Oreochromis niloticus]|nr:unnamed protein product [Mustela putorius furo]